MNRLFDGTPFDWSFRMRSAEAHDFFSPTTQRQQILEHKKSRIGSIPSRYLGELPRAGRLIEHLGTLLSAWQLLPAANAGSHDLCTISLQLEPDILLADAETLTLVAASVCMPSSWSLEHTLGKSIHSIHATVPRLNARIGQQIDRFLRGIPEGKAFRRANWSITLSDDLDYHPDLQLARPNPNTALEQLYLRIEHQLFTSISGGILMGIRIEPVPFPEICEDPDAWRNFAETIRTMPDDVAAYKGMLDYRDSLAARMLAGSC